MSSHNRGATVVAGLLLRCLLLSHSPGPVGSANDNVYRLLVLHTNDMHSNYDETNRDGGPCVAERPDECCGGFARIKWAVDQERSRATDVDGTLFLNAGDTFQGTPFYTFLKWTVVAKMIQPLGIDVMSLGNHEFDEGVNDLQLYLHNITIPVVASNLDLSDVPLLANAPNLMKSKILIVNGRKIGIIGYLTPETVYISRVENVKILPEIPSIKAEVKRLKKEGVNILIALGHSGFDMDKQIAKEVEDIDLVIGGHTNTFLYNGKAPGNEEPVGSYPFWVVQPNTKRKVPVVQASHITKYLGKLYVEFDSEGEVINSYGNPILMDHHIKKDRRLEDEIEVFEKIIHSRTKNVIGSTSVFLEGVDQSCRLRECNFGNFVLDSFVNYNIRTNFKTFELAKYWTDAPISISQSGGFRSNINHLSRNGNITFGDLISSLPFQNDIGKVTVKGSEIWDAFELSVRRYNGKELYGEFLQTSGLKVVIDLAQPSGKRVQSIYARCGNCTVPVYQKLDLNENYTIIISIYLSDGGDGYALKKVIDYQSIGQLDLEIIEKEIRLNSPIHPEIEQRIILLNADKLIYETSNSQNISTPLSNLIVLLMMVISLLNNV